MFGHTDFIVHPSILHAQILTTAAEQIKTFRQSKKTKGYVLDEITGVNVNTSNAINFEAGVTVEGVEMALLKNKVLGTNTMIKARYEILLPESALFYVKVTGDTSFDFLHIHFFGRQFLNIND